MGNLEEQYERLIERLYHEDNLFAQRTSHFIATHAFLAAALAFSLPGAASTNMEGFPYLVALFGLLLSLFYIPLGLRSYVAIRFWREWLKGVESKLEFKLDTALFEFYEEGAVETIVGKIDADGRKMNKVLPWRLPFMTSTNLWLGVWLPALIAFFWAMAIVMVDLATFSYVRLWVVVTIFLLMITVLGYSVFFRPAVPTLSTREEKEE